MEWHIQMTRTFTLTVRTTFHKNLQSMALAVMKIRCAVEGKTEFDYSVHIPLFVCIYIAAIGAAAAYAYEAYARCSVHAKRTRDFYEIEKILIGK